MLTPTVENVPEGLPESLVEDGVDQGIQRGVQAKNIAFVINYAATSN